MSLRINDPQAKLDGFFPEYEHLPPSSFQGVLEILDENTNNETEKGTVFEQLVNRDSPDQTNFPGYSSFWDTVNYNPAFQGRQMRA